MKILVVDDDDFTTRMLHIQLRAMGLKESGYEAIELCAGGSEALARLAEAPGRFGLVFCDLQMPGIDGVEFMRHLSAMGYAGGVVLISGSEQRLLRTVEALARKQGLDVLGTPAKPVTPASLRALLQPGRASSAASGAQSGGLPAPAASADDAAALQAAIIAGELFNDYRPRIDLVSGDVVGIQSVARWHHRTRGILSGADFLPLADAHSLATPVARAVLANALHDARAWPGALDVIVEASLASIRDLGVPDRVDSLAEAAGFPLDRLVIALGEGPAAIEPHALLDIASRFRLKGVRLAVDAFGDGLSSFAQWRDLPFSELRIDRAFVAGMADDASRRAVVQGALALARELDVLTVADGVEDAADLACLRAMGCHRAQGALFADAMAASAVSPWLAEWPRRKQELLAA